MAGFSVNSQVFGAVTQVSTGLLSSPVSGLLGLGWQNIASSGQPPFWQTLASKGAWSQPVMGFQFTRYVLRLIYSGCIDRPLVSSMIRILVRWNREEASRWVHTVEVHLFEVIC